MPISKGPKCYWSYQDFEREEIRPLLRIGFSIDDLETEATFRERDIAQEDEVEELDFG